ncbi:MAG: hypothetical protein WAO76_11140 [Georgfuchsia sp.]
MKAVPWAEVISNSPKVAEGAKKLWESVARRPGQPDASVATEISPSQEDSAVATLEARLVTLEQDAADLREQMIASSDLIKSLAEQNTQLITRIEANRIRILWLTALVVVLGMATFVALVKVLP